jgi:hypothetical protein
MHNSRAPIAGAYWEYLVAFQIVADLIPRHRDYYEKIEGSRSPAHYEWKALLLEIQSSEERYVRIKEIIKTTAGPRRPYPLRAPTLAARCDATTSSCSPTFPPQHPPADSCPMSPRGKSLPYNRNPRASMAVLFIKERAPSAG